MRKLPIGIQSFEKLITDGFLYVDKTDYVYQLAHMNVPYFLRRPRRFGKSLLLSTLRAYWEGKRELFTGLKIEKLESGNPDAWKKSPVFYFDFAGGNYNEEKSLENILDMHLKRWEALWELRGQEGSLAERFKTLLINARRISGLRCVVLVDEYDKPLLEAFRDQEKEENTRCLFKGFFSSLKSMDEYIQFIFISGATKFEKISIFSDLNQLRDISYSKEYAGICGITEEEVKDNFKEEVDELAEQLGIDKTECLCRLKQNYDGYRFNPKAKGVYNPFSLLNALADGEFRAYWFATGTPTFLVEKLRDSGFDIRKLSDGTLYAGEARLSDYRADMSDPVPLLYQTGYLTIVDYDERRRRYTLGYPNDEVKYGLTESLMPAFVPDVQNGTGLDIYTFDDYIEEGNLEGIRNVLTGLFANIPYTIHEVPFEHYFQSVIYILFTLLGQFAQCERYTWQGRIDCIVETRDFVYLFEFKRDDSAESALKQIEEGQYEKIYAADKRKVFKIGVNFDSRKRMLDDWKVIEG